MLNDDEWDEEAEKAELARLQTLLKMFTAGSIRTGRGDEGPGFWFTYCVHSTWGPVYEETDWFLYIEELAERVNEYITELQARRAAKA